VPLEEMHVFDTAKEAVERGGENDDGDMRATTAKERGHFGAELAGAEVIVEYGDVDIVEELGGFFDGRGGDALVAVLTQDGSAEMEIVWLVVEQQDAHGLWLRARHLAQNAWYAVGRLYHGLTSLMMLLSTTIVTINWLF
jgi:hypothetical protein